MWDSLKPFRNPPKTKQKKRVFKEAIKALPNETIVETNSVYRLTLGVLTQIIPDLLCDPHLNQMTFCRANGISTRQEVSAAAFLISLSTLAAARHAVLEAITGCLHARILEVI